MLSQLVGVAIIIAIGKYVLLIVSGHHIPFAHTDSHLPSLSARHWCIITGGIAVTTVLEAYTWQIDNLILAVFQYAILVTFLN